VIFIWLQINEVCLVAVSHLLPDKIESGDLAVDPIGTEDIPELRALLHKYRERIARCRRRARLGLDKSPSRHLNIYTLT